MRPARRLDAQGWGMPFDIDVRRMWVRAGRCVTLGVCLAIALGSRWTAGDPSRTRPPWTESPWTESDRIQASSSQDGDQASSRGLLALLNREIRETRLDGDRSSSTSPLDRPLGPEAGSKTVTSLLGAPPCPQGQPCDDGNACTVNDTCVSNSCAGGPPLDCDDQDPCTTDTCHPLFGCLHSAIVCDDGEVCTTDACEAGVGCMHVNNSFACDDGDSCTTDDRCVAGACVGGPPQNCDDGTSCTNDSCSPAAGCAHVPNTPPCDDGNACTVGDYLCGGSCIAGSPANCDDGNDCTEDVCLPSSGCVHANNTDPCDDGNACTDADVCESGSCVSGDPVVCVALGPCDIPGTCNPSTGLCSRQNQPDGTPCSDGSACTQVDTCQSGICIGGNPVQCAASDGCHIAGLCDPYTGQCSLEAQPNGVACSDSDPCTFGNTCNCGSCGVPNARLEVSTLRVSANKRTITWGPPAGAPPGAVYDVLKGQQSQFPVGTGPGELCLIHGISVASFDDFQNPAINSGFWYLARHHNSCGTGSYGSQSNGTPRVSSACP